MSKVILKLENVDFSIGNKQILKNISFELKTGEILSIIGVNGAGKSTLIKIIAGIYKNYKGKITKTYKKISYVPQKIDIDSSFPINVLEFIKIYNSKLEIKKINEFFKSFESEGLKNRKMSDLSGGELQKVLIISSLLNEPELLLLDEPTAGIDVIGEEIFYKNILKIKKLFPKISIILVSHNLHLVYKNSDKVICLHKDNYYCQGTPTEIKDNEKLGKIFGEYVLPYKHNPHKIKK